MTTTTPSPSQPHAMSDSSATRQNCFTTPARLTGGCYLTSGSMTTPLRIAKLTPGRLGTAL